MILNTPSAVYNELSYFIEADNLVPVLYEDNSVHFQTDSEDDVFVIPTPFMFDSSDNPENNYNIKVDVKSFNDGYIYTLSPDTDWFLSSDRVYPCYDRPCCNDDIRIKCIYQ